MSRNNRGSYYLTGYFQKLTKVSTITTSKIKKMSPQLIVADINRSVEFYTKKLGFEMDFLYEDFYAGISKDGFTIHLKVGKPSIEERQNKRKMKISI
jgi:hypothetical protein